MPKPVKYEVSLGELETALDDRDLGKDEKTKLEYSMLGGVKLREELEDTFKDDVDKTVQISLKSHGIYIQTDRDLLKEKVQEWTFMVRVPIWGGSDILPKEWLEISRLAELYSSDWNGHPSIRLTTRQSIQFHKVTKKNLLPLVRSLIELGRSTLNACGDNTRNPVACVHKSGIFDASKLAKRLGEYFRLDFHKHLEIMNPEHSNGYERNEYFNYHSMGLPRKFKIGIGGYYIDEETGQEIRCNCTDVLTNDLGIIPIIENKKVTGYQVYAGGGLGQKNGKVTFPALAGPFGIFKTEDDLIKGIDAIVNLQQQLGDRKNRHWSRFKNLIITKGLGLSGTKIQDIIFDKEKFEYVQSLGINYLKDLVRTSGISFDEPVKLNPGKIQKHHGWSKQYDGKYSYGFWIETGRITDYARQGKLKSFFEKIVKQYDLNVNITAFQDLYFSNISAEHKDKLEKEFEEFNNGYTTSTLRKNSLACVGLPSCPLAISDSERYFNPLFNELEKLGLGDTEGVSIGISGCERHCSRNVRHDISIEGKGDGFYQLKLLFGKAEDNYLSFDIVENGKKYLRQISKDDIPSLIKLIIDNYVKNKTSDENSIAEFHKRIGVGGVLELIGSSERHSPLLDKTYEPYFA